MKIKNYQREKKRFGLELLSSDNLNNQDEIEKRKKRVARFGLNETSEVKKLI